MAKKTELEKAKGKQIANGMRQAATPGKYSRQAAPAISRKEQRKLDQAAGLLAFAVKLPSELIGQLRSLADERKTDLNALTAELLQNALKKKK